MKALFLSHENSLRPGGGGNEICTREYHDVLAAAGFDLRLVTHGTDRSLTTRLQRKLLPSRYPRLIPNDFLTRVREANEEHSPDFVFCNFTNYIPLAAQLRALVPAPTKLVLLSHGLVSVDDVHRDRIAAHAFAAGHLERLGPRAVGEAIMTEMKGLPFFDHVFCLAEFEVPICRWLGARSVSWWPRTIPQGSQLDWRPEGSRIGLVGTLDHPPNLEGVHLFCQALAQKGGRLPRLRLVTRSAAVAEDLRRSYAFVDDLGPLEEPGKLEAEAATWSAYVHPIFCYAMGCSTKVATGLAWGLPLLTSEAGLRGYAWSEGKLQTGDTPGDLADLAIGLLDRQRAEAARAEVIKAAQSAPSVEDVATLFRQELGL